jgi:hypothetical protein
MRRIEYPNSILLYAGELAAMRHRVPLAAGQLPPPAASLHP